VWVVLGFGLALGPSLGATVGYAVAADREAKQRESCQRLTQELLRIQSVADESTRPPLIAGDASNCLPPRG